MSKRWRRTASFGIPTIALPTAAPRVVTVVANNDGTTYTVTFDRPVTWDGHNSGTFDFPDGTGTWLLQLSPTSIQILPQNQSSAPGVNWDWGGPDTSLSPIPDDTQTGMTS